VLYFCERYNVRSWGSGEEYIRQFQQLYTTRTGQYLDRNVAKEVYKVCFKALFVATLSYATDAYAVLPPRVRSSLPPPSTQ
jgi:hypothetical protein